MKSLAEHLGMLDAQPSVAPAPAEDSLARALDEKDPLRFAQAVLNSQEFKEYIVNSLKLGEIPSGVLLRIMDYAWGRPIDKLEVKTTVDISTMTAAQLEERAAQLREMAAIVRRSEEFSEPLGSDSVH